MWLFSFHRGSFHIKMHGFALTPPFPPLLRAGVSNISLCVSSVLRFLSQKPRLVHGFAQLWTFCLRRSCRTSVAPSRPRPCPPRLQTWRGRRGTAGAPRCRLPRGPDPYQWVRSPCRPTGTHVRPEQAFIVPALGAPCRVAGKRGQRGRAGHHRVHPRAGHGAHRVQALQVA